MKLQGKNLSTDSPLQPINYSVILSMITIELSNGDIKVLGMQDFISTPLFSHNNLSLDYVIVLGDDMVGVVGRGKCD